MDEEAEETQQSSVDNYTGVSIKVNGILGQWFDGKN